MCRQNHEIGTPTYELYTGDISIIAGGLVLDKNIEIKIRKFQNRKHRLRFKHLNVLISCFFLVIVGFT